MDDTFLTYNFKKPEYIENTNIPTDFMDISYPVIDNYVTTRNYEQLEKLENIKPKEEKQEEKLLPKPETRPLTKPSRNLSMVKFKQQLMPEAERIAKRLNVDPNIILAQAFHESGGNTSKSLFGIKAQKGYKGTSKVYNTGEHINGKDVKIKDSFRTYDSISDSFDDYANLISGKRYSSAIGQDAQNYYQIIKDKGYATDPKYVNLLMNVYNQMINS